MTRLTPAFADESIVRRQMIDAPARHAPATRWGFVIATSLICSGVLLSTMTRASLWTDEAFSAYMASEKSVGLLVSTLIHGDSSDLLTSLYYLYLHAWASLFSSSELALRAANTPFVLLSCFALCWASQRIFQSRTLWLLAAVFPFSWAYAADARAHFSLVAWSAVCFAGLLAYLNSPSPAERRWLPYLVLASLALGLTFNVLMILTIPPLIVIGLVYWHARPGVSVRDWQRPFGVMALPFLAIVVYIGWVLSHGTPSQYPRPDALSAASVLYRFAGLTGYGPNRRYDTSFGPYVPWMVAAGLLFLLGLAGAALIGLRSRNRHRTLFISTSLALLTGISEMLVLSFGLGRQEDLRHLASLEPLLVLAIMAGLAGTLRISPWIKTGSLALICLVWLGSDLTVRFSPEYRSQGEDFRSAVQGSIELQKRLNADIALVADPAAGEYYGLDLEGAQPCFPLVESCRDAFDKVDWKKSAPAVYAALWNESTIKAWLARHAVQHRPVVVLISQTRHPMYRNSPWWRFVGTEHHTADVHGFVIQVLDE